MELRDYYKMVEEFRSKDFNSVDTAGLHGLAGLTSEVGEIADLYKKAMFKFNIGVNRDDIIDECGDVLYYLQMELAAYGSNLQECMDRNSTKLKFRMANGKDKVTERKLQLAVNE